MVWFRYPTSALNDSALRSELQQCIPRAQHYHLPIIMMYIYSLPIYSQWHHIIIIIYLFYHYGHDLYLITDKWTYGIKIKKKNEWIEE